MQGDFFQVLRRVQKEERNKSSLARVDNDFYKQLRDYIKDLERSVANDPFGNEQLLLNNAQRIATEICELRESKITQAANNNIYRSFLLFKKDNPQFDLLDTTPLNLTDEEETLYFSLMDALKNHRYRISLDEYSDETAIGGNYEDDEEMFDYLLKLDTITNEHLIELSDFLYVENVLGNYEGEMWIRVYPMDKYEETYEKNTEEAWNELDSKYIAGKIWLDVANDIAEVYSKDDELVERINYAKK